MDGTTTTPTSYSDADAACVPVTVQSNAFDRVVFRQRVSLQLLAHAWGEPFRPSRQCLQAANERRASCVDRVASRDAH